MKRCFVLALALCLLMTACGGPAAPTPDLVATQIVVEEAAHATMTAKAPTATSTPTPTDTLTPTATETTTLMPTSAPTRTNTPTATSTLTASPTNTPTDTPAPTWTPTWTPSPLPSPSPAPKPKPTKAPTSTPEQKVEGPSLDKYRVYYSDFKGTTIAENENTLSYSIWSMRGDGQEATMLFSEMQEPALSLDGTKLAFVHLNSGIVVYNLVTGEGKHVITNFGALSPSFSPDGNRLAYTEYTALTWSQLFTANTRLHLVNVDGTTDIDVLPGRRPAWSPTANLVLYEACENTKCGIMVLNVDTGNSRFLVGESAGKASWSADGRTVTYSTDADGDSDIWSINLDGTGQRKLTDNSSTDALAAWSPDGQYIYFLSDRKGGWGIWVMRPDGTEARKIRSIGVPEYWQWAKMAVGWNK
jgi:WD40 repeat protein